MTYLQSFEVELAKKLESGEDKAAIVRWVSEKMQKSFRNGILAGQKGAEVRDFKSNRSALSSEK
jgi:hypothetical protein